MARLEPFTVSTAEPAAERVAVPRDFVPRANATVPVGIAVPDAALTVAVNCVVAPGAMLAGLDVTVIVVPTDDAPVTLTVTVPVEAAKLPLPA